jgi:sec-independent protein translocase protein TatA
MPGLENPLHIAMVLIIVLLVFGAKRLPELGRSLGSGMREFKHSITGVTVQPSIGPPTTDSSEQRQEVTVP